MHEYKQFNTGQIDATPPRRNVEVEAARYQRRNNALTALTAAVQEQQAELVEATKDYEMAVENLRRVTERLNNAHDRLNALMERLSAL
jgi:exonuclease VII small subunit